MDFAIVDRYLLEGSPDKSSVVASLLRDPEPPEALRPYMAGLRALGARVPDLALVALRLAGAGKRTDDDSVVRLRDLVDRARAGGPEGDVAKAEYWAQLGK